MTTEQRILNVWQSPARSPLVQWCIVLMATGGLLCSAFSRSEQKGRVEAQTFAVVDEAGRVLAELGTNRRNGSVGLFLFDSNGHKVAEFEVNDGRNPELTMNNKDGAPQIGIMLLGDRQKPRINLYASTSSDSHPVVTLATCEAGEREVPAKGPGTVSGLLRVYDANGELVLREGVIGGK